jgi:hypothetical protein
MDINGSFFIYSYVDCFGATCQVDMDKLLAFAHHRIFGCSMIFLGKTYRTPWVCHDPKVIGVNL